MRASFLFFAAACATLALPGAAEARKGFSFGGSARAAPSPVRSVPAVRATPAPAPAASGAASGRPVGLFIYRPASSQQPAEQQHKEAASPIAGQGRPAIIQPAAMNASPAGIAPQRLGEQPPQETRSAPGFRAVN